MDVMMTDAIDYSKTLYLPQTDFPMRAGLPENEPKIIAKWQEMDLYKRLREDAAGKPKYVLHDGPPYANGNLHIGHALNKILKDVITRSFQMRGFDSNYVPGWDCHGLPIEWKIEEQYRAKGKNKDEIEINEFRKECREFATHWVGVQSEEFQRLGVIGDFKDPYLTMNYRAEAKIAGELMKFAMTGQLYRGSKPVMWSVVERTALAEAEIEYELYESDTVWVKFPVETVKGSDEIKGDVAGELLAASIVIWTTTPWTIPGNRAICFSSKVAYGLFEVTAAENDFGPQVGEKLIFAKSLADGCAEKAKIVLKPVRDVTADELAAITCAHPLAGWAPISPPVGEMSPKVTEGGASHSAAPPSVLSDISPTRGEIGQSPYSFTVPLLDGDHVTEDAGTGFVHTAPSHGRDDFEIWVNSRRKLEEMGIDPSIPFPVADDGSYTKDAPGFEGEFVLDHTGKKGGANNAVIKALIEQNNLFARGRVKHEYPHSWRSKKPVIFRNTPQWFVHMDKDLAPISPPAGEMSAKPTEGGAHARTLRSTSLAAIEATRFVPAGGRNRLHAMIAQRPDWVLSRQRAWGVPISVFRHKETGQIIPGEGFNASQELADRIMEAFTLEGADAWYKAGAKERFLGGFVDKLDDWEQVRDILDVWFDSGSTHAFCLEERPDLKWPADLYLEGSDQHRGWFHSSLLESCGTRGRAPYDAVLTHGFVMAEDGRKMSKSLGNVVTPQEVIKNSGADILRLWVVSSDYSEDLRIGPEILKTAVDAYRKYRNTMRWMLGTLAHDQGEVTPVEEMPELEQLMLHRLSELDEQVRKGYDEFEFRKITKSLMDFMVVELSAFYFDIRKDSLYCDAPSSARRKASIEVVRHLFKCLIKWTAPLFPFTTEEAWLQAYPNASSVHLEQFDDIPANWRNDALAKKWTVIKNVRRAVTGALEVERAQKRIGSSLEASPTIYVQMDDASVALLRETDLAEICITSGAKLEVGAGPDDAFRLDDLKNVAVVSTPATGKKCARSWRYTDDIGADANYPDVSARDAAALRELQALGRL
jgi:isoleucyl-tRNA synthetase